jgi:acyl-CoA thioester hydrolase
MLPFSHRTRVRFVDTDASGRIHYTALFRYFEAAEVEFLRSVGITYASRQNYGLPRVHAACNYRLPLTYDDLIDVELRVGNIGTTSLRFDFLVYRDCKIAADGTITAVFMDQTTSKAIPIPADVYQKLTEYTGAA